MNDDEKKDTDRDLAMLMRGEGLGMMLVAVLQKETLADLQNCMTSEWFINGIRKGLRA